MSTYIARLHAAIRRTGTGALVGLDPRWELLPQPVRDAAGGDGPSDRARAYEEFCCGVIEEVRDLVPAVKPQSAFFEQLGPPGVAALQRVIQTARDAGLIVILDAKRGDIGSTAEAYAAGLIAGEDPDAAPVAADALTISPYLGPDTLEPFVERANAVGGGLYVLVRTSNPQSAAFQDRTTGGQTLYEAIGAHVESLNADRTQSDGYGSVGAVIGATYPEELVTLRKAMPSTPLLIPGYGSQGGTAADVRAAFDAEGFGALVNSSRGILFAFRKQPHASEFGEDGWRASVRAATEAMIEDLRGPREAASA